MLLRAVSSLTLDLDIDMSLYYEPLLMTICLNEREHEICKFSQIGKYRGSNGPSHVLISNRGHACKTLANMMGWGSHSILDDVEEWEETGYLRI